MSKPRNIANNILPASPASLTVCLCHLSPYENWTLPKQGDWIDVTVKVSWPLWLFLLHVTPAPICGSSCAEAEGHVAV